MTDERTEERAALWMMLATLASDGNYLTLGYDADEGQAFVTVTDETFTASSLAAALREAFKAREVR